MWHLFPFSVKNLLIFIKSNLVSILFFERRPNHNYNLSDIWMNSGELIDLVSIVSDK